jgi:hypothetical protein
MFLNDYLIIGVANLQENGHPAKPATGPGSRRMQQPGHERCSFF